MATVQLRSDFCFFILCTVLSISYLNPVSCNTTETITPSSSIETQTMSIDSSDMAIETSSSVSTEQTSIFNNTTDESNINSSEESSVFLSTTSMMNSDIIQSPTSYMSTTTAAILNGTRTLDTGLFSSSHTAVSAINISKSLVDGMSETIGVSSNISPTSSESASTTAILNGTESQTIGMFSSHTVLSASDVNESYVGEMTNTIAASSDISIYPSEQGSTSSNYGQISHTAMTSSSLYLTGQITSMQASLTDSVPESSSMMMDASTSATISSIPTSVAIATSTDNIIMSSYIYILPTSSFSQGSDVVTSSVVPTTTTTTTTTTTQQPTTALPDKIMSVIDTNSVFKITTDVILTSGSITNEEQLRNYIIDLLKDIDKVRDVIVLCYPCINDSRRKKRSTSEKIAQTETVIGALNTNLSVVADDIIEAFNNTNNISISNPNEFKSDVQSLIGEVCNTSICDKYVGYTCDKIDSTRANCYSQCYDEKCSGHGECKTIITGANQFGKKCICHSEEYYKYEGEQCGTKRMKWELAVAIAAGSGGAVILILIFILILCCCRKSKEDRYEYRQHSYEPMSEVLGQPGPACYRNEGIKTHQSGMINIGYEDDKYSEIGDPRQQQPTNRQSWNPDDSKDTYDKISQQLDQGNGFQIKRPHVTGASQRESGVETTGF